MITRNHIWIKNLRRQQNLLLINRFATTPTTPHGKSNKNSSFGKVNSSFDRVETRLRLLCEPHSNENPQFDEAVKLFGHIVESGKIPSPYTCNFLLGCLCRNGEYELAFKVYHIMRHYGVSLTYIALSALLESFIHSGKPELALAVLTLVLKHGYTLKVYTFNLLLKALSENGMLDKALDLLLVSDRSLVPHNLVSFNTVIDAACNAGRLETGTMLLGVMLDRGIDPDIITYNPLIYGLSRAGKFEETVKMLDSVMKRGLDPNAATFTSIISPLCRAGRLSQAKEMFDLMLERGKPEPDVYAFNVIIDAFFRARKVKVACDLLTEMRRRGVAADSFTFKMLLRRFLDLGLLQGVVDTYNTMTECGAIPNVPDYDCIVRAYIMRGQTEEIIRVLQDMDSKGVRPDIRLNERILEWCVRLPNSAEIAKRIPNFFQEAGSMESYGI